MSHYPHEGIPLKLYKKSRTKTTEEKEGKDRVNCEDDVSV